MNTLKISLVITLIILISTPVIFAQEILPFPPPPSESYAGPTMEDSVHKWPEKVSHLPEDAPNILIIMFDDAGFAHPDTFGGEIHTPSMSRLAEEGISYNAFHTTAMCSPTRASLLTGRNHHRVGNGQVAELANAWDGYSGEIPKTCATFPEVLNYYGYNTAAFGKWHNTPAVETTAIGPFDRWPTGHGFDYFYGFLGGETSQYEPRLYENTTPVEPPHDPEYHLTTDMADKAIAWMRKQQTYAPDSPFLIYWTPGAVHGPHHIQKEWSEKYKGKFDEGWDVYREVVFERQKEIGWIPEDTILTPRHETMPAWDSLSDKEKEFQARLMEVYAGFLEHTDVQAGRLIDELDNLGIRDNTIVIYILSDNGASAEGIDGSICELLAQNGIPTTVEQHMDVLDRDYGGLDALGGPKLDSMYHSAWAWTGSTPFQYTKLIASHFGGTRTPMIISWPDKIKPDGIVRNQFHHVNDIAPTIYEILDITPPRIVDGFTQEPLDGVSMVYTFKDPDAEGEKIIQYFDIMGSRSVYFDGWIACAVGARIPWIADVTGLYNWDPSDDKWELYDLENDFSQAIDVADEYPEKVDKMKEMFSIEAANNKAYPIGGGLFALLYTQYLVSSGLTEWSFYEGNVRTPEVTAPKIGSRNSIITVDAEITENASGVLYAMGGISGGITLYMDNGYLCYEYNSLTIDRSKIKSAEKISPGHAVITVETELQSADRAAPADITIYCNDTKVAEGTVTFTVPGTFTCTETFDVGTDLGSPVSLDYYDLAPFSFDGTVNKVHVKYTE